MAIIGSAISNTNTARSAGTYINWEHKAPVSGVIRTLNIKVLSNPNVTVGTFGSGAVMRNSTYLGRLGEGARIITGLNIPVLAGDALGIFCAYKNGNESDGSVFTNEESFGQSMGTLFYDLWNKFTESGNGDGIGTNYDFMILTMWAEIESAGKKINGISLVKWNSIAITKFNNT